jgi:hypothetical protein
MAGLRVAAVTTEYLLLDDALELQTDGLGDRGGLSLLALALLLVAFPREALQLRRERLFHARDQVRLHLLHVLLGQRDQLLRGLSLLLFGFGYRSAWRCCEYVKRGGPCGIQNSNDPHLFLLLLLLLLLPLLALALWWDAVLHLPLPEASAGAGC